MTTDHGQRTALELLPYQRRWVEDNSPLKIVVKGRQTGFSFAATLRAVLKCLERRTTWVLLSKGERQSRLLMEKVHEHIQSCGIVAQACESTFFEGATIKQLEVRFPNGSVIYGLPANPDTARGYSGHVTLDEFAFHLDADKIYAALYPTITRGYSLEVISTPNGQQGKFFELAKEAGLTEGPGASVGRVIPSLRSEQACHAERSEASRTVPNERKDQSGILRGVYPERNTEIVRFAQNDKRRAQNDNYPIARSPGHPVLWSGHWCDVYEAARQGLGIDLDLLRAGVDEETWRQEFCCEFLSSGSQWIPHELFERCVSSEASSEFGVRSSELTEKLRTGQLENLYAGWDVARNRDLSVIWLSELVGDVTWTRGVIEMRNLPTPDQVRQARAVLPLVKRMEIDQGGMGLAIAEALAREFPDKVEGVTFTAARKETLAVTAKRRMEEAKVRLPDSDAVRESFRSVKKAANALGQSRFDADHDSKSGHADHWWAFCLAEAAAARPETYHLAEIAGVVGRPLSPGLRSPTL